MYLEIVRASKESTSAWTTAHRHMTARLEVGTLCETLSEQIARGVLPPDDAYWWTRAIVAEVTAIERMPSLD
jgi:hypothetical protein